VVLKQDYNPNTTFALICLEVNKKTGEKYTPFYKRASDLETLGLIDVMHGALEAERENVFVEPGGERDTLDIAIDSVYKELYSDIRQGLLSNSLNDVVIDLVERLKSVKGSININDINDEEYGTA
jgi:hypothetical protein